MGFSYSTCLIVAALLLNVGVYAADTDRVSQVHLGVTPTAGEVTVSWATQAADSSASCTVVQYGTSEKLGSSATGNSTTYTLITCELAVRPASVVSPCAGGARNRCPRLRTLLGEGRLRQHGTR